MQRIEWKDQRALGSYQIREYKHQAKTLMVQSFYMLIGR
jgi:hypothetical protein